MKMTDALSTKRTFLDIPNAESLRKSVSGLSRSVANFSYWVRISSAGRPRRELNYLEYHPTTFWRKIRGQTPKSPQLHFEFG